MDDFNLYSVLILSILSLYYKHWFCSLITFIRLNKQIHFFFTLCYFDRIRVDMKFTTCTFTPLCFIKKYIKYKHIFMQLFNMYIHDHFHNLHAFWLGSIIKNSVLGGQKIGFSSLTKNTSNISEYFPTLISSRWKACFCTTSPDICATCVYSINPFCHWRIFPILPKN